MYVDFKYNADKQPTRLVVTEFESNIYQTLEDFPGAVISTTHICPQATLPLDDVFVYMLQNRFCKIAPAVQEWMDQELQKARNAVKILEQTDAPGNPKLRAYQRVDVEFMKNVPVVLNANEMGTGKTIEAYALVDAVEAKSVLIICGKSKMQDWEDEGITWSHGSFLQIKGTRAQKEKLLATPSRYKIINYSSIRTPEEKNGRRVDLPGLWQLKFDIVIFDEAHRVKNKRAKRTGGAIRLSSQAQRTLFLTGTPMLNAPQELFPILQMAYPKRFTSYWAFVARFCQLEENPFASVPKITGIKHLDHLQFILAPIMVRRKKKDVLPELPDKIYKDIKLELEPKQRAIYKKLKKEMLLEFENGNNVITMNAISLMVRLRQICCTPKLIGADFEDSAKTEAFLELVDEFVETGEKLVVFSFFESYLSHLASILTTKKIRYVFTSGKTKDAVREQNKKVFKDDPECSLFMCTTETGGEGLNLQHAHNLLFLDRPWTPAAMAQAEDRIHRMGQTQSPLIITYTCKGTVEEYIAQVVATKDSMITEALAIERVVAMLRKEQ